MKHVLVSYHPYDKSFNTAIVRRIKETIGAHEDHTVDHIDLAQNDFNPVMGSKELYEFAQARTDRGVFLENLDPQAVEYAQQINRSDHLILIFPIWWELMPAQIKGFIDKVIFPGLFYTYKSEFSMRVISDHLKKVTVITTMNTPKFLYSLKYRNSVKHALVNGTFKKLGIKKVRWTNLGFIKNVSNKKRGKMIDGITSKIC